MQVVARTSESTVDRRNPVDRVIAKSARCADPRATYTPLFFSENPAEAARAKAICSRCTVRQLCLARAIERQSPSVCGEASSSSTDRWCRPHEDAAAPARSPASTIVDEITGETSAEPAVA